MINATKERLMREKLQFIEIDKNGLVLNSENNLFNIEIGTLIYDVDPVFEAIRYYISDDPEKSNFHLSCINLDIGNTQGIFDILIEIKENVGITIVDFTTHYKISNTLSQERNESVIQAQILREQEEFKNRFLTNTSHELRTPLSTIMGFTTILKKTDVSLDQMHSINIIRSASEQLKNIIDDILDITKIEMGNLNIINERFDFNTFLDLILDIYTNKNTSKDIVFAVKKDKTIPNFLVGDKYRLQQILGNILDNAYKFTEQGRITLTVKNIEQLEDKISISFVIKDMGIGIPKDKIDSIFESFTQVNTNNPEGGTGLGLSIVKNLLNLMDGTITVESKKGRGSTFKVQLDFDISENQKNTEPAKTIQENQSKERKKYSVLIAEDIESNQLLLMKILINQGDYYFDIASNGDQVIELLHQNTYDLILMDLKMPTMDGYDTTRFIRQSSMSDFKDIPIIAVTAKISTLERDKCIERGMNDYIAKPFEEKELLKKMKAVLKQKERTK